MEKSWEDFFQQLMGTESFAETSQQGLRLYLHCMRQLRQETEKNLELLNFPTRKDIARLSTEILDVGDRMNSLEDKLDQTLELLRKKEAPKTKNNKGKAEKSNGR
ncbi:MAG: hypothetical protein HYU64_06355 [Armatimonadetes bacterium]|nr:hypothetical protein [Armatimonadota bacterium]